MAQYCYPKDNAIGKVVGLNQNDHINIFTIDRISEISVSGVKLERYISNNWQYASVGREIITFKNLEKLDDNSYKILHITRGEIGTEEFINSHEAGEDFAIIVNSEMNVLNVSARLENKSVEFKSCDIEKSLTYQNKAQKTLTPYITRNEIVDNKLYIEWITRIKNNTDWELERNQGNMEFYITIKDGDQTYLRETRNNKIIINLRDIALSADYRVSIVTKVI